MHAPESFAHRVDAQGDTLRPRPRHGELRRGPYRTSRPRNRDRRPAQIESPPEVGCRAGEPAWREDDGRDDQPAVHELLIGLDTGEEVASGDEQYGTDDGAPDAVLPADDDHREEQEHDAKTERVGTHVPSVVRVEHARDAADQT